MKLILASSSTYRKELFTRLKLDFECLSPDIDESPLDNETPHDMVIRLAKLKAIKAQETHPDAVCIGSDTVANFEEHVLGKPGNLENAIQQLEMLSGKQVEFLTGICVLGPHGGPSYCEQVPTIVQFKSLTRDQIEHYCQVQKPFHSCGSFKSETNGCALIERQTSDDPTAIIGLPLIKLSQLLEKVGVPVL